MTTSSLVSDQLQPHYYIFSHASSLFLAEVPTFLVAGHETTATAMTWALYALCLNLAVQTKLREELYTLNTDAPSMDEIKTLTYLDWFIRETMRMYAPVPSTVRVAMRDDVLPMEDGSVLRCVAIRSYR